MAPYGNRMAIKEDHELKNSGSSITIVTGEPGHLDQYPYIDSWLGLAQDPTTWQGSVSRRERGKY